MRYLALCCDYDGTLAHDGAVSASTRAALERCIASGRRVLLVTGRELPELRQVCSCLSLFSYVVAENGALLYRPDTGEERPLAPAPPARFVESLQSRGVGPISVGRVIVATWEPHETAVLETIRDLGLELQVIFNKGAVMVLPAGVNKATGLAHALGALGLSAHNAVAVGDAENDQAFLAACECGVAVSNALPALKQRADFTTTADHGDGVAELIDELVATDLAAREPLLTRHHVLLGHDTHGRELRVAPYGTHLLVLGSGRKSSATSFLERLTERGYSYCVIDARGELVPTAGAVMLGTHDRAPSVEEILQLLAKPAESAAVSLAGVPERDQPAFFATLLPGLQALRARSARPHWIVLNESQRLWPGAGSQAAPPAPPHTLLQLSAHPELIPQEILKGADTVVAVGERAPAQLRELGNALGEPLDVNAGVDALVWLRSLGRPPAPLRIAGS